MSKWYTQVTYRCKCEIGYRELCNKTSRFILQHNCSCDVTRIFHKSHIENPESKYVPYELGYMNDEEVAALTKLLNLGTGEGEKIADDFIEQRKTDNNL